MERGESARRRLLSSATEEKSLDIQVWPVDLANYSSVKAFSERLNRDLPRLDGLVANAGISTNQYVQAEGLESTLTINVVSTMLLGALALPKLQSTAAETRQPSHLTFVGSVVHCFADEKQLLACEPGQVFSTLSTAQDEAAMSSRYFLSKLILILCVRALASSVGKRNDPASGVIINFPNPAWCKTDLFRQDDGGAFARNLLKVIGRTGEVGARTLTSAVASSAGVETHGRYLSECQVKRPSVFVESEQGKIMEAQLWAELLDTLDRISPGLKATLSS